MELKLPLVIERSGPHFARCWLPHWNTRLYFFTASTIARPSAIVSVSGFWQ